MQLISAQVTNYNFDSTLFSVYIIIIIIIIIITSGSRISVWKARSSAAGASIEAPQAPRGWVLGARNGVFCVHSESET